jgi:protoporphyrinogen oxidase
MNPYESPLVVGAGPAGLTAALRLASRGVNPQLFECGAKVGGLAHTGHADGWRIDPGGHRFFTQSAEVAEIWRSLLPFEEWVSVDRTTAMMVHGEFVPYPLAARDLLVQLGLGRGMRGLLSFIWARARRSVAGRRLQSFEEWGVSEFGRYWYDIFFDSYTRKTWRTSPNQISYDWAHQRIKSLDWRLRRSDPEVRDVFSYPRLGPGQVWDAAAAALADLGVVPRYGKEVIGLTFHDGLWQLELQDGEIVTGGAVFSSMPLRQLIERLQPIAPQHVRAAAAELKHRNLVTVAVPVGKSHDFPFTWVYAPDSTVRTGRIQNYGHWSRDLVRPHWDGTLLGFEYYDTPSGELWTATKEQLARIVERDLLALNIRSYDLDNITIVRSNYAYPIYDTSREKCVGVVRDWLTRVHPTLFPIGRNGMHRYDNQDHAMLSAMRSVDRYFGEDVDPWLVNTDPRHHENQLQTVTSPSLSFR